MSEQREPSAASSAAPIAIAIAFLVQAAWLGGRMVIPKDWIITGRFYLISSGISATTAVLFLMGFADLARRLPVRQAAGARIAMTAYAVILGLMLAGGVIDLASQHAGRHADLVWKIESYAYLALYLVAAVGAVIAAGGTQRAGAVAVAVFVLLLASMPPDFLSTKIRMVLGSSYRVIWPLLRLGYVFSVVHLAREAARSSTQHLPAEPAAPFALLGSALRGRVVALFVLVALTLLAMGGRTPGAMKIAMVVAPLINVASFTVFAIAALRASRGLGQPIEAGLAVAAGLSAWCAGVVAIQGPALYDLMTDRADTTFGGERQAEIAQSLTWALPLIATTGVVVALLAIGAYLRRAGHLDVVDIITSRTTAFVVLFLSSILLQAYIIPKASSMSEFLLLGVLAAGAGIAALLVAANVFKRASEAASTSALPTATVLS